MNAQPDDYTKVVVFIAVRSPKKLSDFNIKSCQQFLQHESEGTSALSHLAVYMSLLLLARILPFRLASAWGGTSTAIH